ncbi:MAG: acyl-CoA dehydrogenase family protein [Pseudohongiellaceae bacterium]
MSLVLGEEQLMLQDSAREFCRENAPIKVMRRLRDSHDSLGYDPQIWTQIVALGWPGMAIPEAYGGYDFGYTGLGLVLEETGRCLLNSPLISTVLLCASAIRIGGTEEQKKKLLPQVVAGSLLLALAIDEAPHHQPSRVALLARKTGSGFTLNGGSKRFVLDGHIANKFIVSARTSGEVSSSTGISLFVVDADTPGVKVTRQWMVDSRNSASLEFNNVQLGHDALLGEQDKGLPLLQQVLDIGCIGVAAEMLGSAQEVLDRTIDFLKQREQFGVPIGAFQGLQHRAAIMFADLELCRSAVRAALHALDHDPPAVPALASLVKARVGDTFFTISNEGVQMHGGVGMTDEFDIGFFLKRARVAQQFLGDEFFHRDRYAALNGF